MKNISALSLSSFLISIVAIFIIAGCQKNIGTNNTTNSLMPDSVITNNYSLHYIYDGQERVIEERMNRLDSLVLLGRTVYEYIGTGLLPFKKTYFDGSNSNPTFSAEFNYNSSGKKTYDSAYFLPGSGYSNRYSLTKLDYSIFGRIIVFQKIHIVGTNYTQIDTIVLNNSGNVDSVSGLYEVQKHLQYDSRLNHLKPLSINQCNYYRSKPDNCGFLFTSTGYNNSPEMHLDYFDINYCTSIRAYNRFNNLLLDVGYQYHFNNDNLPISRIFRINGTVIDTTRYVYK